MSTPRFFAYCATVRKLSAEYCQCFGSGRPGSIFKYLEYITPEKLLAPISLVALTQSFKYFIPLSLISGSSLVISVSFSKTVEVTALIPTWSKRSFTALESKVSKTMSGISMKSSPKLFTLSIRSNVSLVHCEHHAYA